MKRVRTLEGFMMRYGKKDDTFFSEKEDRHLTAISNAYKRKIKTERVICVTPDYNDLKVKPVVKVTLLDEKQDIEMVV